MPASTTCRSWSAASSRRRTQFYCNKPASPRSTPQRTSSSTASWPISFGSSKPRPTRADTAPQSDYARSTQAGGCSLPRRGRNTMAVEAILVILLVGAIAGWLAGLIVRGIGFGLIGNIVVGIVGAFIAAWLLPRIGIVIGGGIVASIINATIGAVVLLVIIGLIKRA